MHVESLLSLSHRILCKVNTVKYNLDYNIAASPLKFCNYSVSHKENLLISPPHWNGVHCFVCGVDSGMTSANQMFWNRFLLSTRSDLVLLLLDGLCSAQSACTTGSNKTDLATSRCIPPDCWGFADVLMVTTTEGMLNRLQEDRRGGKEASLVWGLSKGNPSSTLFSLTG